MRSPGRKQWLRIVEIGLWSSGLFCLSLVTLVWLEARLYQAFQEWAFEQARDALIRESRIGFDPLQQTEQPAQPVPQPEESGPELNAKPKSTVRQKTATSQDAESAARPSHRENRRAPEQPAAGRPERPVRQATSKPESSPFSALARLRIPSTSLSVMVGKADQSSSLRRGVAHIDGTSAPGENGNVGIAGHRDTFFRSLQYIRTGQLIILEMLDRQFEYQVEWTAVVEPRAVDVLDPTDTPSLTLVTCYPFHYVGDAPLRFIVRAVRLGEGSASVSQTSFIPPDGPE